MQKAIPKEFRIAFCLSKNKYLINEDNLARPDVCFTSG